MMNPSVPQESPLTDDSITPPALPREQAHRTGLYSLLAALLRAAPGSEVLDFARQLDADVGRENTELAVALGSLALAARHSSPDSLREEYHNLFIGLGRGELVPYGSWYQTGFLMEKPLGLLRADLARLGFERDDEVHEPEDHIAALCEVMALLIQDQAEPAVQRQFFNSHIANWADRLFSDLAEAQTAVFYRSVARLGRAFLSLETTYLSLPD